MSDTQTAATMPELDPIAENVRRFYIDGAWVDPVSEATLEVIDPATERSVTTIALGGQADVDAAVAAARRAFETFSQTTRVQRIALLERVIEVYAAHRDELAGLVRIEMGAPAVVATRRQAPAGLAHFKATLEALRDATLEEALGSTSVVYEPVGVCALITPWNWPLNQIAAKVAPALATGCTMVLKPSEIAPLNAIAFAQILDEAGVPAGVFNLVNGDGPTVGAALTVHPDVDMVSFTGSTRAGVEVARGAAATVKRVAQELGGKSANIFLDDDSLPEALARDVAGLYVNSGQSCNAGARMLVPTERMQEAMQIARATTAQVTVGAPDAEGTAVGPVVSQAQYEKVQALIEAAIEEGATLVVGGPGRPEGLETGYYVRPTVFADVTNDMRIAREEIFGPVLTLIGYRDEDDAVRIANDTSYGLAGMVSSTDPERARRVARRMRAGMVHLNGAPLTPDAPFGGYRQSGNGREYAAHGLWEFLEAKSIYGDNPPVGAVRYGYKASAEQFGPRQLIDYARLAEELGLETIAVSDHFQPWRHQGGHTPAVLPWLGALGEGTREATLGTSVLTPTMRYHPSIIAQSFATLALLNPGRIFLGVGTGEALNETPATARPWPGAKERRMMLREAIALIRQLWSEERVTFQGDYYRTDRATIYDRPQEMVPIYVAASGPLAAKLAGRVGDGFIATSGKDPDLYRELLGQVAEGAQAAGRDAAAIDRFIEIKVSYDHDVDYARRACAFWAPLALTPEEKSGIDDATEMEAAADRILDRAPSRFIVSDDPDEVVERIAPYVEVGFEHLVFHGPGHDQERFLRAFCADVLPRIRDRFGAMVG